MWFRYTESRDTGLEAAKEEVEMPLAHEWE